MAERGKAASARPAGPSGEPRPPVKVIYVMGAGRSGSTILGVALGNSDGMFFAGELDKWLLMSGESMHEREGEPRKVSGDDPGLWEHVREDVAGASELFGKQVRQSIEHSTAPFRLDKAGVRRRLRGSYREVTAELYRAIAKRTGAEYVVDSSHFPLRARELQSLEGVELHLLFLVRDARSVVASWERPGLPEPRSSMLATNAYLWLTYVLSLQAFFCHPRERRLLIRYEDFIANPEEMLRVVLDSVGSAASIPDLGSLRTGMPFHGNRLIFSEVVSLHRGTDPPPRGSRLTRILQLPWQAVLPRLRPAARSWKPPGETAEAPGQSQST